MLSKHLHRKSSEVQTKKKVDVDERMKTKILHDFQF